MGTKALALVVLAARQAAEENREMTGEVTRCIVAAEAELEAIRKAAKVAHACGLMYPVPNAQTTASEWEEAVATMDSLAKEGP